MLIRFSKKPLSSVFYLASLLVISACTTTPEETVSTIPENNEPSINHPSTEPLSQLSKEDYFFVQQSLLTLGFNIGLVDGIWGKRSKKALDNFHLTKGLPMNDGLITAADLFYLKELTSQISSAVSPNTNQSKPDSFNLSKQKQQHIGPELVILTADTELFVRDNPFSEVIAKLQSGTGVYILKRSNAWFEVESEDKEHGYIKVMELQ